MARVRLPFEVTLDDRTRQPAQQAERNIDRIGDSSHAALGRMDSLGGGGAAALGGLAAPAAAAAGAVAAVGFAAVKAGQAFVRMINDVTGAQRELLFLSESSGVGIQALSVWAIGFEELGGTADDAAMAIREVSARIGETIVAMGEGGTGGEPGEALRALNLDVQELARLKPEDQLRTVLNALNGVGNESLRSALANQLLSDQYAEMLPLLSRVAANYDDIAAHAVASGRVISEDQAERSLALRQSWERLTGVFTGLANTITDTVAPPLTALIDMVRAPIQFVVELAAGAFEVVKKGLKTLGRLWKGLDDDPRTTFGFGTAGEKDTTDSLSNIHRALRNVKEGWGNLKDAGTSAKAALETVIDYLSGEDVVKKFGALRGQLDLTDEKMTGFTDDAKARFSAEGAWGIAMKSMQNLASVWGSAAADSFGEWLTVMAGGMRVFQGLITQDWTNVKAGTLLILEGLANLAVIGLEALVKTGLTMIKSLNDQLLMVLGSLSKIKLKIKLPEFEAVQVGGFTLGYKPAGFYEKTFSPFEGLGRAGFQHPANPAISAPATGVIGSLAAASGRLQGKIDSELFDRFTFGQDYLAERDELGRKAVLGLPTPGLSDLEIGILQREFLANNPDFLTGLLNFIQPGTQPEGGGPQRNYGWNYNVPQPGSALPPGDYTQDDAYTHWRGNAPVTNINIEGSLVAEADLNDLLDRRINDRLRAAGITIGGAA